MDFSKLSALLFILLLSIIYSTPQALACDSCPTPKPPRGKHTKPPKPTPPKQKPTPPTPPPPTPPPPAPKGGGLPLPPIPIIGKPPISLPPITLPPILTPPVTGNSPPSPPPPPAGGCPAPPPPETCPLDTLKLGVCLEILGNPVHIGDPAVNQCCALIQGVAAIEAALCLCTTIKLKLLNINIFLPIALQLLVTCGKTPPPGYTCP